MAAATLRQGLRQVDVDVVGLAQILAQDVAQRDVQHRRRGDDLLLLLRIDRRIREEADHRLGARLLAGDDLFLLRGLGEMNRDVLERRRGLAGRGQRADVLGQQRDRLVHLEGAHHEEREVGGVLEPILVERDHLVAAERLDALGCQRLRGVVPGRVHLRDLLPEELAGRPAAVGDRRGQLLLQQRERLGVVARRGEILVEQLQRRFELCRRRAA